MINVGDLVLVDAGKFFDEKVKCKVIYIGEDETGKRWYECEPVDFTGIPREFPIEKIEKCS